MPHNLRSLTSTSVGQPQASKTVPAVNQVELHPYLSQSSLVQYCEGCGIRVMGYSPLGGSSDRAPAAHGTTLLQHPTVNAIAKGVNKTPGQVLIRWALQCGVISIPKSSNPERLAQNFATLDWQLGEKAMEQLAGLESDFRCVCLCACGRPKPTLLDLLPRGGAAADPRILVVSFEIPSICSLAHGNVRAVADARYFISYLKKPDNNERWHDGKIEQGNDEDWVGDNRDGANDWA
mgnify:CR=1 FL=1|jgi:hypothetical protein